MTKIFIEAEDKTTPEYNFLKAFVKDFLAIHLK